MEFTEHQQIRYSRHFMLQGIGQKGQEKLLSARVLCVGAGALGSVVLPMLASAGVGVIGIADDDVIELSNLQRQTLYNTEQIGQLKVDKALEKLKALNNDISINTYPFRIDINNAEDIIQHYDYVIDCTDNLESRYLLNAVCVLQKIPYIYAGIHQFMGQCSVFSAPEGPCYHCLFPEPPQVDALPNCAEAGVLNCLPGLIGSLQANELFKLILGIGKPLIGKLFKIDALSLSFQTYQINPRKDCECCSTKNKLSLSQLIKSPSICSFTQALELSIDEAKNKIEAGMVTLLDIREENEKINTISGSHSIPFSQWPQRMEEILSLDAPLLIYCTSGKRSLKAAKLLKNNYQMDCYSLKGGITANIPLSRHPD